MKIEEVWEPFSPKKQIDPGVFELGSVIEVR